MSLIFIETITGEILRVFTWLGNPGEGIARAKLESKNLGNTVKIWHKSVN